MKHRPSLKDLSRAQFLTEPLFLAALVAIPGVLFAIPATAASATGVYTAQSVDAFGIPVDFILFGLTLLGVAIFHNQTLQVALTGLAVVTLYKLVFTGFRSLRRKRLFPGLAGEGRRLDCGGTPPARVPSSGM